MSEHRGRDRHRLKTLILVAASLLAVLAGAAFAVANAESLNQVAVFGFPLGFYLLAQGLLFALVAATFWITAVQDRIDRAYSESEEP